MASPPADQPQRPLRGIAYRLLAAALLSAMFAVSKLAAARGVHLVETLFWRQAAGVPVAFALAALGTGGWRSLATARPGAHVRRMVVGLSAMACNFAAVMLLPLAEATVIGLSTPVFATVLAATLLRERTGPWRWGAVAAGFAGVLLVLAPAFSRFGPTGLAVALLGAVLTALVTILIRDLGRTESAATTVFWFSLASLVPLGLALPFVAGGHDAVGWALIAGTAVIGAAAQIALTAALRHAPVALVMPMDNSALLWSVLAGAWLFGTWPAASTWAGAALIIGSVLVIAWRTARVRLTPPR